MAFRPDPAAQTGTYDTTDTAGVSARYGRVEDTTAAFDLAEDSTPAGTLPEPIRPPG